MLGFGSPYRYCHGALKSCRICHSVKSELCHSGKESLVMPKLLLNKNFHLFLVLLLALSLRLIYLYQVKGTPVSDIPVNDSEYYHDWATRIVQGEWIGDKIFFMAPLYAYLIAIIYFFCGVSINSLILIQGLIATISCAIIYFITQSLISRKAAVLAGFLFAAYGVFIFYDGQILKASFLNFFNIAMIGLFISARNGKSPLKIFLSGIFLGASAAMRPNIILFVPFLVFWIWFIAGEKKNVLLFAKLLSVFTLGTGLVIFPIALRNYTVGGEWVLTVASGGLNFYIGNNATANGIYVAPKFVRSEEPEYEGEDFRKEAGRLLGREVSIPESSSYWFSQGMDWMRNNPLRSLKLLSRKFLFFWHNLEVPSDFNYYVAEDYSPLLRVLILRFGVIAPFGLLGLFLFARKWKSFFLIYSIILTTFLTNMIFFVSSQYRLPMVPFLIIFAAGSFFWIVDQWINRKMSRVFLSCSFLVGAALFINQDDRILTNLCSNRTSYIVLGSYYEKVESMENAESMYLKALEIDPHYGLTHIRLSRLYSRLGRESEAQKFARQIIDRNRVHQRVLRETRNLSDIKIISDSFRQGNYERVKNLSKKLIKVDPKSAFRYYNNIGLSLYKQGKYEEALLQYKLSIDLKPDYSIAHYNRGLAYLKMGKVILARKEFQKCLELDPHYHKAKERLKHLKQ